MRFLYPAPANEESLYGVLTKWSVVISEYGIAINSDIKTEEGLAETIELSTVLKQKSKEFFIQSIVGKIAVQDKRELTTITQSIITRLLDQLFALEEKQKDENNSVAIKLISEHVKEVFDFYKGIFLQLF